MWRADLHCHTTCSDGALTPQQLVDLAIQVGLQGLSVTDHDTVFAYRELLNTQEKIAIGSGVELSCVLAGHSVHLLGYDFLPQHPLLLDLYRLLKKRRQERNGEIVNKLYRRGFDIRDLFQQYENNHPGKVIGRPHLAAFLLQKKYVVSIEEAFHRYLGDTGSCFVLGASFTIEEAFDFIKRAKGKLFIAHPYLIKPKALLKKLLAYPFDGIEVYYSRQKNTAPFIKIAKERKLLISGGSDFHGGNVYLGSSWVEEEVFCAIFENRKEYLPPLPDVGEEKSFLPADKH